MRNHPMSMTGLFVHLFLATSASANAVGSITVDVDSIDVARGGNLAVYVYTDADKWLKPELRSRGTIVPVTESVMTVEISGIPHGEYAVSVIQDLNGNEKIDMSWFPIPGPAEPSGVSNNAKAGLGAPSFEDAKFQFDQSQLTLSIALEN